VAADVFNAYVDVADVCIDLRHPTAGETSASLLRLLAAGKPTFITASGSFLEIPRDVAVHVPLDAHEVDFLAAALFLCYQHREFAAPSWQQRACIRAGSAHLAAIGSSLHAGVGDAAWLGESPPRYAQ
jgi:hypothetical protein